MAVTPEQFDRRQRRRLETIEEVLDHAVDIMAEEGVAGLSLGEIARRMRIRPPSLYVYFPSKDALYDALFARGWRLLLESMRDYDQEHPPVEHDLELILLRFGQHFVRWSLENFAFAQLLFWRPVPGFRPSESAYEPAVELYQHGLDRFAHLQDRGLVRSDVEVADVQRDWAILIAGVISQQLANAPQQRFDRGRYTAALPGLAAMFAAHYRSPTRTRAKKTAPSRRGHAGQR